MTDSPSPAPRKRGAQPGNQNALRHGFYAKSLPAMLKTVQPPDPDGAPAAKVPDNLGDELARMRLMLREVMARARKSRAPDRELSLLRAVTHACAAINQLIRAQLYLNKHGPGRPMGTPAPTPSPTLPGSPAPVVSAEDLQTARAISLDEEIEMLRYLIQRVTSRQAEWTTLEKSATVVSVLAFANRTLCSLLRSKRLVIDAQPVSPELFDLIKGLMHRTMRTVGAWSDEDEEEYQRTRPRFADEEEEDETS